MIFNSLTFLWFFLVVYSLYLILDHRRQNGMLLVASCFFYGWWDWRFLTMIFVSTLLDYHAGLGIHEASTPRQRKVWLVVSMVGNLGLLGLFKYFDFFAESFAALLQMAGLQVHPWTLRMILPLGISFYTFQTMSYTIDIYRGQLKPTRDFLNFALFVSFFPQLVAGPIERARNLLPQVERPRRLDAGQIKDGLHLVAWGLFKKIIIADHVAVVVNEVFGDVSGRSGLEVWLAFYAFFLQLYGDFSGYSDIARGLAKMMGFELMVNFRNPLCAERPSDFWSRWHISLTTFVRDYLFVSIGGMRKGAFRMNINLLVTMTVIGLWHGANWTFVLWGFYFGVLQVGYNVIHPVLKKMIKPKTQRLRSLLTVSNIFLCTVFVIFSACLFRAENIGHTVEVVRALGNAYVITPSLARNFWITVLFGSPLLVMEVWQYRTNDLMVLARQSALVRLAAYMVMLALTLYIFLFNATVNSGEEFIYFQF